MLWLSVFIFKALNNQCWTRNVLKLRSHVPIQVFNTAPTIIPAPEYILSLVSMGCGVAGPGGAMFPDVVDAIGCKERGFVAVSCSLDSTQACLAYEYDGASVLELTHVNTAFNCAASFVITSKTSWS